MDRSIDAERLRLLDALGFEGVEHDSHVPFKSHLIGTHRQLKEWGCPQYLCDAGLFHSAYGTEFFAPQEVPGDRDSVRAVIGERAERLAWLWCNIDRTSIDLETQTARNFTTGETIRLADGEADEIAMLWAADTVEQMHRMKTEGERAFARGLERVLHLATETAQSATRPVLTSAFD